MFSFLTYKVSPCISASSFSPYFPGGGGVPPRPQTLFSASEGGSSERMMGNGHAKHSSTSGSAHVALDIPETHKSVKDEASG